MRSRIKNVLTSIVNVILKLAYNLGSLRQISDKKVVLASSREESLNGNLLYIYNEFQRRDTDLRFTVLLDPFDKSKGFIFTYLIKMIRAVYHFSNARLIILDDYYYPLYVITPRSETEIVQVWHAAGAFKKFGLSLKGKADGPSESYLKKVHVHGNYTKAIVSSKNVIPYYAEAFGMSVDSVLSLGVPRVDFFYDNEKKQAIKHAFYNKYPELKGKRLILYAPTYKGSSYKQDSYTSSIDFNHLKNDQDIWLIKLHPYITKGLDERQNVDGFTLEPEHFSTHELMLVSDILVTDYSSVIFEFSILNKPIIFMVPDLEEYYQQRDFYFNFENFVPGNIVENSSQLSEMLNEKNYDMTRLKNFRDYFFDYQSFGYSKRVVDYLINEVLSKE